MITPSKPTFPSTTDSKPPTCPAISLTTDFGTRDEYVAVMKAVLLSRLSASGITVQLIDISHEVPAQDVRGAAFLFGRAYRFFPIGTVHLVVVDPGVGSDRRIIAIDYEQQLFVGPDNGVFTTVLDHAKFGTAPARAHEITNSELFLPRLSSTFHGRDIMAPVAASLASGMKLSRVGNEIDITSCTTLPRPHKALAADEALGEIVHIDRFGNLCTNLSMDDLQSLLEKGQPVITVGSTTVDGLSQSYADSSPATLLAHFDSHFQLEIAVRDGSAKELLQACVGDEVRVRISQPT